MTKSLALAHAADGIRVNCVCPGFVETDMWALVAREQGALMGLSAEEFTRQRAAQVPLGRMETAQDVANVIAFLASPRAGLRDGPGAQRRRRPRHALAGGEKGSSASLAPSAARSTYREYASRAAFGRRLASEPFSSL